MAGHDVVADGAAVRRSIGLAGQHTSVDECLTGRANLVMLGRLSRLGRRQARDRAAELLVALGLDAAAGRPCAPTPAACAAVLTWRRAC